MPPLRQVTNEELETIEAFAAVAARHFHSMREQASADVRAAVAKRKVTAAAAHAVLAAESARVAEHGADITAVLGFEEASAMTVILDRRIAALEGRAQGPA